MDNSAGELDAVGCEHRTRQPKIDLTDLQGTLCRYVDALVNSVVEFHLDMDSLQPSIEQDLKLEYELFFRDFHYKLAGILKSTSTIRDFLPNIEFIRILNNAAIGVNQFFDALTRIHIVTVHFFDITQHFRCKNSVTLPPDPTLHHTLQNLDHVSQLLFTIIVLSRIRGKRQKNPNSPFQNSFSTSSAAISGEVVDCTQLEDDSSHKSSEQSSTEKLIDGFASLLGSILSTQSKQSRRNAGQNQALSSSQYPSNRFQADMETMGETSGPSSDRNDTEKSELPRGDPSSREHLGHKSSNIEPQVRPPVSVVPGEEIGDSSKLDSDTDEMNVRQENLHLPSEKASMDIGPPDTPELGRSTSSRFSFSNDEIFDDLEGMVSSDTESESLSAHKTGGATSSVFQTNLSDSFPDMEEALARARMDPGIVFSIAKSYYTDGKHHKAFIHFEEAKRLGSARADYYIGECYFNGLGVVKNLRKAFSLYLDGSRHEDSSAMYKLGVCFEFGFGVLWNIDFAIDLYRSAANLGSPLARTRMAVFGLYGVNIELNHQHAAELLGKVIKASGQFGSNEIPFSLKASAHAYAEIIRDYGFDIEGSDFPYSLSELALDHPIALALEAERHAKGYYGEQNIIKAERMYKKLVSYQSQDPENWQSALHKPWYGLCLMEGSGSEKNGHAGRKYVTDAIGETVLDGVFTATEKVSRNIQGITIEDDASHDRKRIVYDPDHPVIAAADGNAWFVRGKCYREGIGSFTKDLSRARKCFLKASSALFCIRGMREAHIALAEMYEKGEGGDIDCESAIHHYLKAGNMGDLKSIRKVALMFANGQNVSRNLLFAVQLLHKLQKLNSKSCEREYTMFLTMFLTEAREGRKAERIVNRGECFRSRKMYELTPIQEVSKMMVRKALVEGARRDICKLLAEAYFNEYKMDLDESDSDGKWNPSLGMDFPRNTNVSSQIGFQDPRIVEALDLPGEDFFSEEKDTFSFKEELSKLTLFGSPPEFNCASAASISQSKATLSSNASLFDNRNMRGPGTSTTRVGSLPGSSSTAARSIGDSLFERNPSTVTPLEGEGLSSMMFSSSSGPSWSDTLLDNNVVSSSSFTEITHPPVPSDLAQDIFSENLQTSMNFLRTLPPLPEPSQSTGNDQFGNRRIEKAIEGLDPEQQNEILERELERIHEQVRQEIGSSSDDSSEHSLPQDFATGENFSLLRIPEKENEEEIEEDEEITFDEIYSVVEARLKRMRVNWKLWLRWSGGLAHRKRLIRSGKKAFPDFNQHRYEEMLEIEECKMCYSETEEEDEIQLYDSTYSLTIEESKAILCKS